MIELMLTTEVLADQTCVVGVEGDLDLYTVPELERRLMAVTGTDVDRVVVDLTECTFLDSTALGVLIAFNKGLGSKPGLRLVATDRNVLKVFEITGLDRFFDIAPSRLSALGAAASV